ncbi:amidohydrolase [Adhaeribacter swui]|uniref:Amidohydrolase n=1 Tax=Adhaeribacter swui TaxID=2086471 RepID=A0A7G7G6T5_9BACT|nr:amidohydrolase family protein [Adhaeribacter swui]QNF32869.1 amidohydrolase [Adhaeribacter swui]
MKVLFQLPAVCRMVCAAGIMALLLVFTAQAQEKANLRLLDWRPRSELVVPQTEITKPKFPVIDIHNHLGSLEKTEEFLKEMDKAGVTAAVSLDGHSKDDFFKKHLKKSAEVSKDRFLVFFAPDWERIDEPNFGQKEAKRLTEAVKLGARGIKVYKRLGLTVKDKTGKVVPVDDARLDPIWAKCGELGIPVLMHVSDPVAFFKPIDQYNERYDELAGHPEWGYYGNNFPSKEEILAQRNRVLARHPKTIFIGAHVANLPENLGVVSQWLDEFPNLYVEIGARISELGRQPVTARKFMIKYQDRVLFGTDTQPSFNAYKIYYRFLETADEYFDPAGGHHLQGRWMIYGLQLPDEVLEKVYNKNAQKILSAYAGKLK